MLHNVFHNQRVATHSGRGFAGWGIGPRSLTGQIDATNGGGELIFHISGALAEFERDLIRRGSSPGSFNAPA